MQTGKIISDLQDLENDPAKFDSLIGYVGKRTREELKIILGLKRKAFSFLCDKCHKEKNLETELAAFLAAAANYRTHRPHNARTLEKIDAERRAREERHPHRGGLRGRLEEDFEDVSLLLANGYTWREVARELKTRNTKYRGLPTKPETIRKTFARIKADRATRMHDQPTPEAAPEAETNISL